MQYLRYTVLILFCLIHATAGAQLPKHKQWENIYGTGENDNPHKLYDLGNGDFAANGFINGGLSGNDYGHWFVFDADGKEKVSGFGASVIENMYVSIEGGLVFAEGLACMANKESNDQDFSLTITDSLGGTTNFCFGTFGNESLEGAMNLNENGMILYGSKDDRYPNSEYKLPLGSVDGWIVALDPYGRIEWENVIGGSNGDVVEFMSQLNDSTVLALVKSSSNDGDWKGFNDLGAWNYFFVELYHDGKFNVVGQTNFDSIAQYSVHRNIIFIGDYCYIAAPDGSRSLTDGKLVKINYKTGEILFKKTIGGSEFDGIFNIHARKNGNLIIGGKTESSDGDFDGRNSPHDTWLMELDSMGNIVDKFYPQGRGTAGNFVDFLLTDDEEIIVLSANGDVDNFPEHYGPFEHEQPTDFYIYKLGYQPTGVNKYSKQAQEFTVFPNPNNTGFLHSSLIGDYVLLDTQGRRVKTFENTQYLDVGTLNKGLYLLHHSSGSWKKVFIE